MSRHARALAIVYLLLQGIGTVVWWVILSAWPASRTYFLPSGAPDSALLAFVLADLLLFAGGSLMSAAGLALRRSWAWPALCIHAGAGVYAALYCVVLAVLDPQAWLAAVMMAPSLVVLPLLVVWFRPDAHHSD